MGLIDGSICIENGCHRCCLNTEMILTQSDIDRISKLGYKVDDFAYFDGKYWRLRNVNNRCYFLTDEGLCRIYENRPMGCMAYPVIFVDKNCVPDKEVCPYSSELTLAELIYGCKILKEIYKEIGEVP